MPKKKKSKIPSYGSDHVTGDVIRNQFVSGDGTNPVESLKQLQEIFRGKVDGDVVQLVFSECGFNVEQALESLFTLSSENELKNEISGLGGLPNYSDIRPKVTIDSSSYFGKNISMDSITNVPLQISKSCTSTHKVDKHLCDFAASKSSWAGVSNSSDSSANDSDFSDPVSRRNSRELRHRYIADVVCHKPDTSGTLENLKDNSYSSFNKLFDSVSNPTTVFKPIQGAFIEGSSNEYETIYPQTQQKNWDSKKVLQEHVNLSISPIVEVITLINQQKKIMVIIRGLPGSGKTTLAKNLVHDGIILSTDDYFYQYGEYFFDPNKLSEAHSWNKDRTIAALKDEKTPIIIDNTNTESWEMLPYISVGLKHSYCTKILEPETSWKFKVSELARRNVHKVSKQSISRMLERYEHGLTVDDIINRRHPNVKSVQMPNSNTVSQHVINEPLVNNSVTPQESPISPLVTTPLIKQESPEVSSTSSPSVSTTSLHPSLPSACARERLDLEDLLALAQQDSEDSQSASRRTSASSSQDASGWECDEEFTWTYDEAQAIAAKYAHYLTDDIIEENEQPNLDDGCQSTLIPEENISKSTNNSNHEKIEEWFAKDWDKTADNTTAQNDKIGFPNPKLQTKLQNVTALPKSERKNAGAEWDVLEVGDWSSNSDPPEENGDLKPQIIPEKSSDSSNNSELTNELSLSSEIKKNTETVIYVQNKSQTISEDFAILQRVSSNDTYVMDCMVKVLTANPINFKIQKEISLNTSKIHRKTLMFDKGTITDSVDEIDKDTKIKLLSSMFPSVTHNDLEYILEKCSGDHNWAMNNLLDSGLEYNNPNVQPPIIKLHEDKKEVVDEKVESNVLCYKMELSSDNPGSSPCSGSDEGIGTDSETSKPPLPLNNSKSDLACNDVTLVLALDPLFAMQLEEMFGSIINKPDGESFKEEDLKIKLDMEAALAIHTLWKKTVNKEMPGHSLSSAPSLTCSGKEVTLNDIMAHELEMSKKWAAIEKQRLAKGENLATRMKRQELYKALPLVDPIALDDIFDTNNYNLPQTLAAFEILGHIPLISQEVAHQTEEELIEQALSESRKKNGLFEDDWLDWVACEEFEDPELKKLQKNLFQESGYNDLRMEAQTYHQLRGEYFRKGQDAYNRGMKTVASFYSQKGHEYTQNLREANQRAANKILEIRNAHNDPNVLDLHGLHRDEAILALSQFISNKKEALRNSQFNKLILFIITGRGLHSANKTPKLKPIVEDFINRSQLRYEAVHEGLFKVTLT